MRLRSVKQTIEKRLPSVKQTIEKRLRFVKQTIEKRFTQESGKGSQNDK